MVSVRLVGCQGEGVRPWHAVRRGRRPPGAARAGHRCSETGIAPDRRRYLRPTWGIPEFGNHGGDAQDTAYVQSVIQLWSSYPPIGAAWYNNAAAANFSQPLQQIPHTLAYLRALAAA